MNSKWGDILRERKQNEGESRPGGLDPASTASTPGPGGEAGVLGPSS